MKTEKTKKMKEVILYFSAATALFFTPIKGLLIGVGMAIMLDTFFGLYRSIKTNGWKSVTSRRLSEVVSKMLLYEVCIISLYIIDFFVLSEIFQQWFSISFIATKMCAILLIFIEVVSIKENFEKATSKDIWKMLRTAVKRANQLKEGIVDLTNNKKDESN